MKNVIFIWWVSACVLFQIVGCSQQPKEPGTSKLSADVVLTNGAIYTLADGNPWAEAVAIKNGKILGIGSREAIGQYITESTQVTDLQGKFVMPGINEAHLHPVRGGIKQLFECNFEFSAKPQEIAEALTSCAAQNPDLQWIVGGQWDSGFFDNHKLPKSPREWLDDISTTHAIALNDDSGHNYWVNSKALEVINITRDTPNPEGGTIVRDRHGDPNGLLLENVRLHLWKYILNYTADQYQRAADNAVATLNSLGITGFKDATALLDYISAYKKVDDSGRLNARVVTCYAMPREARTAPLDIEPIVATLKKYNSANISTNCVKYYLDGVPTAARSAAMLSPYIADPHADHGETTSGSLLRDPKIFAQELIALDTLGITAKIHAAGDRAIRVALDAIETTRKANGKNGPQHELAHAEFVDPVDVPRFTKLDAVADMSPAIWYPSPIVDSIVSAVGERGERVFPFRAMLDSGARVIAGSDWPSAAATPAPWLGMETMVTRQSPNGETPGTLWAEQAISLQEAIKIYTVNGAKALGLEDTTGSLEVGKSADLIILDRNLLTSPIDSISDTQVLATWFKGKLVYQR